MRKLVVYTLLSLDGVAEECQEFITEWDDAMDANLAAVLATQDAVILGRRSYDEWQAYWTKADVQPFADFINRVPKHIVTSRPLEGEWVGTSSVVEGDLAPFVTALKAQPGGDIGVHASISVAQALLAAGLVDELKLLIGPSVHGRGRRLLEGLTDIQLEVLRSSTSPTGHRLVDYRVSAPRAA